MWKLSIEDDQGEKTLVSLSREEYSIGRGETNTVRLTERNISRRHALLRHTTDGWLLEDLQSYNGAYVNGQRVAERQLLAHGDLIQVGDYRLEVADEALVTARSQTTVHDGAVTAPVKRDTLMNQPNRLVMVIGPTPGKEYALGEGLVTIGRDEECDISINHASVSRRHAEVAPVSGGRYEIVDKGSANGVRVNGVDLQRALLDARDNVELGDVVLKYVPAGQIYVPGAEGHELGADELGASSRAADAASGMGGGGKAIIALAIVGVVLAGVFLAFSGETAAPPSAESVATLETPAELKEAQKLLAKGDVEEAFQKLSAIPASSPVRKTPAVKDIVRQWAEARINQAEAEIDDKERQRLLLEVERNVEVDRVRRQRAAELLKATAADEVAIDDLPEAQAVPTPPPLRPSAAKPAEKRRAESTPAPAEAPPEPVAPATPATKSPTLVRDDPFGSE